MLSKPRARLRGDLALRTDQKPIRFHMAAKWRDKQTYREWLGVEEHNGNVPQLVLVPLLVPEEKEQRSEQRSAWRIGGSGDTEGAEWVILVGRPSVEKHMLCQVLRADGLGHRLRGSTLSEDPVVGGRSALFLLSFLSLFVISSFIYAISQTPAANVHRSRSWCLETAVLLASVSFNCKVSLDA